MKIRWWMGLAMAVVPLVVFAAGKKSDKVPAVFGNAQYVYVISEDGDIYNPGLVEGDRQAISDMEDALRKWKRYTLTARPEEAQLIFIVRKGRLATGKLAGGMGHPVPGQGPGQTPASGPGPGPGQGQGQGPGQGQRNPPYLGAGSEVGPPDDLLEVKMMLDGKPSTQIWFRVQHDGLVAPRMQLFKELREAVDRDYPL